MNPLVIAIVAETTSDKNPLVALTPGLHLDNYHIFTLILRSCKIRVETFVKNA